VNPTTQPVKRPLVFPDPIPDSEADRTEQANAMLMEIRVLGPEAWAQLTTFEAEIESELSEGKACTRVRFEIVRDAYKRIKKKPAK
jgi:hypothetical protein